MVSTSNKRSPHTHRTPRLWSAGVGFFRLDTVGFLNIFLLACRVARTRIKFQQATLQLD